MGPQPKLTKENKQNLKRILKKKIQDFEQRLSKELEGSIKQTIESDRNEIKDVGIIVCAFDNHDAPFNFVRTEPLFFFKEKNFDLLIYGEDTIILIDVKESLISDTVSKINKLKEYSNKVIEDVEFTNTIDNKKMKIIEYLETITDGDISDKEFVLSTQKVNVQQTVSMAKTAKHNFCLWKLVEKENKVYIIPERIVGDESKEFYDHKSTSLKTYLKQLSREGALYNDPLSFLFSSSIYIKSIAMSIPLYKRKNNIFNYGVWSEFFSTDMLNWHEIEKQTIFKNYVKFGIDCKFIRCNEDKGDVLLNSYSIVSRHSKTSLLENDIIMKIIKCKVGKNISEEVPKIKKQITSTLLTEQAKDQGVKSLNEFFT